MPQPLILAIEPNASQARQIAELVRQHLKAEIVTAASADAAFTALGDRVPDLILTPTLLPPRDEAALAGRLRDLGPAASHVQTLSVPILASVGERRGGGLLGRRRDRADASESVGCDPALFADQIRIYLERAALDRRAHAPVDGGPSRHARDDDTAAAPRGNPLPPVPHTAAEPLAGVHEPPGPGRPEPALDGSFELTLPSITFVTELDEPAGFEAPLSEPLAPQPDALKGTATEAGGAPSSRRRERARRTRTAPAPEIQALEEEFGLVSQEAPGVALWRVTEGLDEVPGPGSLIGAALEDPPEAEPVDVDIDHGTAAADGHAPESFVPDEGDEPHAAAASLEDTRPHTSDTAAGTPDPSRASTMDARDSPGAPVPEPAVSAEPLSADEPNEPVVLLPEDGSLVAADLPSVLAARSIVKPRPRRSPPPLDDWAYFDPSLAPFRALVRRLDEIAGQTGVEP